MRRKPLGHFLAESAKAVSETLANQKFLRSTESCESQRSKVADETGSNVKDLPPKHLHRVRLEKSDTEIQAIFPEKDGEHAVNISFLANLPNLEAPLAEAFKIWGAQVGKGTRSECARDLKRGVTRFLVEKYPEARLSDLDVYRLTALVQWIDEKKATRSGKATSPNYRRKSLSALKVLLTVLIGHKTWGRDAEAVLTSFPERTHPGASAKSTPRQRLSREHLEAIDAAAQREVREIQERIIEAQKLLEEGRAKLDAGVRDFSDLSVTLAEMSRRYPNVLPAYKQLRKDSPELYEWVYKSNKKNRGFGNTKLGKYLYASPRDLVPFILLLTIEGAFNAESVLQLDQTQIAVVERFGSLAVRVNPKKLRAEKAPVKYLDPAWVLPWFEALEYLTRRLRPLLPSKTRGRIFIYAQLWGQERHPTPFRAGRNREVGGFHQTLQVFIKDNNLDNFTLSQIRPTESDEIGQIHGSLAATQALNHRNLSTTEASYLSSGTRDREGEQLCLVVDQMRRWVDSKGKVDTRRAVRTPRMDRGSATPGYGCAGPYESPRPGQRLGELCGAYGECPSCEQAHADHNDPISVAFIRALPEAIYAGQAQMTPRMWIEKWAPILRDVLAQISHIPSEAITASEQFAVQLPPVG